MLRWRTTRGCGNSVLEHRAASRWTGPRSRSPRTGSTRGRRSRLGMRATTVIGKQKRKPCPSAEKVVVGKAPWSSVGLPSGTSRGAASDPKCKKHGGGGASAGSRNVDEAEKKRRAKAKAEGKRPVSGLGSLPRRDRRFPGAPSSIRGGGGRSSGMSWGMLLERMYHATRSKLLKELGVEDLPGLLEGMDSPQLQRLAAVAMLWAHAQTPRASTRCRLRRPSWRALSSCWADPGPVTGYNRTAWTEFIGADQSAIPVREVEDFQPAGRQAGPAVRLAAHLPHLR